MNLKRRRSAKLWSETPLASEPSSLRERRLLSEPRPARGQVRSASGPEIATFAAGCFWGVEGAFREVPGVLETAAGYTGGDRPSATYKQVCGGDTGHAESVEVLYDPEQVTYEDLLETFWRIHNPTRRNRQRLDIGNQYRSAIFCHGRSQETLAAASRDRHQALLRKPIVTQIAPASAFYRAEEYHQRYLEKQGRAACAATVR
ncbi:MAG TPA: peptide-methionine (S)-S-oxide reductase MsrA [Solirubrobacteraceae bacterium]|jgi:peptide-methionine (S)-S-oxide reductase|nr:peptide-methionine (S)-S-oxide reductase MsrA [Solirubrobacteraceae bacterium]